MLPFQITLHSNNIFELMSVEPVWEDAGVYVYRAGDARERKFTR